MTTGVKICGLSTRATLEVALTAGADLVGFVMYPHSPRDVALEHATALVGAARGRALTVVLVVDANDAAIREIAHQVRPDFIQLQGQETPERVAQIKRASGCRLIKALGVSAPSDIEAAVAYQGIADLILFDAKPPKVAGALPGGNGLSFDWHMLDGVSQRFQFLLAGGLDRSNVAQAIRITGAAIVDVSSGVETQPGVKDARLIQEFITAAKGACGSTTMATQKA